MTGGSAGDAPERPGQGRAVAGFYDALAGTYHALYPDWEGAVASQGRALHRLITRGSHECRDVADVACGIGTQVIGLAHCGHRVRGSDLSEASVARARRECRAAGVDATLCVADMRSLPWASGSVDAVVCADNAVPHLLTDDAVVEALGEMARVLRPNGVAVITTRDYDQMLQERPPGTLPQVFEARRERIVSFQVWHWRGQSDIYDLEHFQVGTSAGSAWRVQRRTAAYRAYRRTHLAALAERAGLGDVAWHRPEETGFFQPVMTAYAARGRRGRTR